MTDVDLLDGPDTLARRCDIAAEQYVLGAVLLSCGRAMDDVHVAGSDFFRPDHEQLWTMFTAMRAAGEPIEVPAAAARLAMSPIRGCDPIYLHDLMQACTSWVNAAYYADAVAGHARLRRMQEAGARLIAMAAAASHRDVDSVCEDARAEIDAATAAPVSRGTELAPYGELLLSSMDRWEAPETGVLPTGLHDLDRFLSGGLRPGHLLIVGARPAVGKSVAASVVAHQVARRGVGVLFASLEMSRDEVVDRVTADVANVQLDHFVRRQLDESDWDRVRRAAARSADWPLFIDDRANLPVTAIRGRARDVSRRAPLGLIVVDYLQLVRPGDGRAPRQEQVAAISRAMKLLAKELQVAVVALAQVNRGPMNRADKRPVMSDIRESGAIEADADEIVLLHRDDKESPGEIEFIIEKNRHGQTGVVSMAWSPHYSRIASMAASS